MRPYEAIIILDSSVDEAAVDANVTRVADLVKSKAGTVGQVEKWGRRRFAYELKHKWEGNYTLMQLEAEPETVADIDRMLTLSDDVLRHKIVRVPEEALKARAEGIAGKRPASTPEAAPAAEKTESRTSK